MSSVRLVRAEVERWPLARPFIIARGAKTEAAVVVVEIEADGVRGRGEAVPYSRYGESPEGALDLIGSLGPLPDRAALTASLPPGAARNALDCALWDLEAKQSGRRVCAIAGEPDLAPVITAYTISLGEPETMAAHAREAAGLPLLKVKLGAAGDAARMKAVRAARPEARLIADANEGWTAEALVELLTVAAGEGYEVVEQPLPQGGDAILGAIARPVSVCADESVHTADDLPALADRYDAVNIKLDKAGGLTAALELRQAARAAGLGIMVGSMVATSLAVAPALILAQGAQWVDLDGPLLLARDRVPGLAIRDGLISPPQPALWG